MSREEQMKAAFKGLRKYGERLMYPIFGVLHQGNDRFLGYFGLTEHHLLIALLSGHNIRIPLDIKSVRIKRTSVLKQYVIDIAFHDGAPCRITASSRVTTVGSQKENLPRFADALKNRAAQIQETPLKKLRGEKIRRQYFNLFIYTMISCIPMICIIVLGLGILSNNYSFSEIPKEIAETVGVGLAVMFVLLSPFIVLSVLNRFFFGKVVSVFSEDGLALENDLIPWKDIRKVSYHPRMPSRYRLEYTYVTVWVKPWGKEGYSVDILQFPAYGLKKMKKYCPGITVEREKTTVLFYALLPTVLAIIFTLIFAITELL